MGYKIQLEPRTERAGLFSEENSLVLALKEINNPKLSIKYSTRGYTLLLENKPVNPSLSPKRKQEMEYLLHYVHSRYVKYLAASHLQKDNYEFKSISETEESFNIDFLRESSNQNITFTCHKNRWLVEVQALSISDVSEYPSLRVIESKIGKAVSEH